jgi:predicted nucleotidyltransferase
MKKNRISPSCFSYILTFPAVFVKIKVNILKTKGENMANLTDKSCGDFGAVRAELEALTRIIIETVPVEKIILFGSYAYGTPHKDSDLDLYVVLKNEAPMRDIEAMIAISLAINPVKTMPVDLLALKKSRYLDRATGPTLERKIAREGVCIYG